MADYVTRLEHANIANSLDNLLTFPRLRQLVETGGIAIHGAYFGVATGKLSVGAPPHSRGLFGRGAREAAGAGGGRPVNSCRSPRRTMRGCSRDHDFDPARL